MVTRVGTVNGRREMVTYLDSDQLFSRSGTPQGISVGYDRNTVAQALAFCTFGTDLG